MDRSTGWPCSRNEGERKREFIERTGGEIDRLAFKAEPCRHGQEGCFVETGRRHRRQAADIGFADRPANLLGDVKQGPPEGIDAETARIIPEGLLEAAILERSHPQRVSEMPLDSIL